MKFKNIKAMFTQLELFDEFVMYFIMSTIQYLARSTHKYTLIQSYTEQYKKV